MSDERQALKPQPGFQVSFLSSPADIVIGGGAAGGGKSYALLLEALRHSHVNGFRASIFRRTIVQVKSPGGLWDTSKEIYLKLRDAAGRSPIPTEQPPKWKFPGGGTLLFSHLEHEGTKYDWDGAQIALLGFDELIHFTPGQFWYLVGRNRSACGVRPYIRATTNPQTSGWVKRLISWWIHPDDHPDESLRGMPIPERAGVLRYLARWNENSYWGDTPDEAISALPEEGRAEYRSDLVKSVTFIPGTLDENIELNEKDPAYKGNLLSQDRRHGSRLLRGCWYDASGENELFRYEDLYDAFERSFVPGGEKYMTCDVAMEGSDSLRIGIWSGLRLERIFSWDKSDGRGIWEHMKMLAKEHKVDGRNIVFDANGVGNFLTGFFKSSYDFRSQSKPLEEKNAYNEAESTTITVKTDYKDLRTQCAYHLSRLVSERKLFFAVENETEREMIMEEFEAHKKTGQNPSGKLTITQKPDIKALIRRSPDYFDMILMRIVFEIKPKRRSYLLDPVLESVDSDA